MDDGIQEDFEQFHKDNPQVYVLLCKLARKALASGRRRYGMAGLFEIVRWQYNIETVSADDFKLNDHFTSRYSRLIMDQEADLKDFFETRALRPTQRSLNL